MWFRQGPVESRCQDIFGGPVPIWDVLTTSMIKEIVSIRVLWGLKYGDQVMVYRK